MYELVEIKNDEAFTTSKIIAEGTGNKHHAIRTMILKYEKRISTFGQLSFKMQPVRYSRGTNLEKVYYLNERQATFLMALMRNDGVEGIVVEFKLRLVDEFFKMREFIRERQTKEWDATRIANKENRLKETDVIKLLVDYAKEQGSENSDKLYMSYTKLAKKVVSGKRDEININDLNNLTLTENIILQTIRLDMLKGMYYKDIYKDCKDRIEQFKEIAYLNNAEIPMKNKRD